ncbi:MAG: 2-oxoacid:ferredoxin oxidoreductase subunit beta [Gemmataceae bacterium]|nr:2-oxoacid:ferredoxin oxidoreductase subunit beta [Gemmataceae bacterium]
MSEPISASDFDTDQEVRWCPSCGDYAVLAQLKQVLASLDIPRERFVFVSGIGCASRLPYYLNTYGFHTLPGRAAAVATGLKSARPDLSVWVITGDGDGCGHGLNHLLHAVRRNVDIKILLFNNEVHGLSKGQFSPTSRLGTRTRTSPNGSTERPLRPAELVLAAGATFVARTIDVDGEHLSATLRRAAGHRGTAFVEILQNCKIFNDGVFEYATDKATKFDHVLYLEHEQPLIFGKDRTKALVFRDWQPTVVSWHPGETFPDLPRHDERSARPTMAQVLAGMTAPDFPECLGVFRCVEAPTFHAAPLWDPAGEARGVEELFLVEDMWDVQV